MFSPSTLFAGLCSLLIVLGEVSIPSEATYFKPSAPTPSGPVSTTGPHNRKHICRDSTSLKPVKCCCQTVGECQVQELAIDNEILQVQWADYSELVAMDRCITDNYNPTIVYQMTQFVDFHGNPLESIPIIPECVNQFGNHGEDVLEIFDRIIDCQDNKVDGPITVAYARGDDATNLKTECGLTVRDSSSTVSVCVNNAAPDADCYDDKTQAPTTWEAYIDDGGQNECPSAGAQGDPAFTGFLGQSFQVHGISGEVYNLISSSDFMVNALFNFLESGSCRKGTLCFGHPGNYIDSVGLKVRDATTQTVYNILVKSGPVNVGLNVTVATDVPVLVALGGSVSLGADATLSFVNQFTVQLETGDFSLRLQNSDHFLNEDVSVGLKMLQRIQQYKKNKKQNSMIADETLRLHLPHGILGQTWELKKYSNRWKYIEGQLVDYVVNDGLLGLDTEYNRFTN